MSVPSCVLLSNNSNIISNTTLQYYQNFAKSFLKNQKIYLKKINKNSDLKLNDSLKSEEKCKIIFNWFSELPLNKRIQLCSINNKWLSRIIKQLIFLYYFKDTITFLPINDFKEFFINTESNDSNEQNKINNDLNFYSNYLKFNRDKNKYNKNFTSTDKRFKKDLINNIKFYSFEEGDDTISLSKSFLENPSNLKQCFNYFSGGNFLKYTINPYFNEHYNLYNFKFPFWLNNKTRITLYDIFVGYIEQNIILNYEYYLYTKKLYDNKLGDKIFEIEELNKNLENFIFEEYKNSILERIDFYEIGKYIHNNENICNELYYEINMYNNVYIQYIEDNNYLKFNCYQDTTDIKSLLINAEEKLKNYYSESLSCFLYNIYFMNVEDTIRNLRLIYDYIYKYIKELFLNKNVNELIEETNENNKKKKKHKKKRKRNKDNIDNLTKEDEKIDNNNLTKDNNNNINILYIQENKDEKKKENENVNIKNENEKEEKIIIQDNNPINQKTKKKKKEKEFFLYPTQQKKKKSDELNEKKIEQKKNKIKENNEDQLTLNSIKQEDQLKKENETLTETSCQTENVSYSENIILKNTNNEIQNHIIYINDNQFSYPYLFSYYTPQIIAYNILKNICLYTPSDEFFSYLSLELDDYNIYVNNNNSILNPIKICYIDKLSAILKNNLSLLYNIDIIKYGSFITNLSIEGSDVDLLIKYKPIQNNNTFISDLISILYKNKEQFDYIKPITTASVPVIKIQFDVTSLIVLKDFPNYIENDDLNKLKFDITFKEDTFYSINYIKTIEFVKESIINFPNIKKIVLFVKRYFKKINLNKSYNGGLSSYSIFLMVLAFLKKNQFYNNISIGKQLYYIIEFYSFFNFSELMINVCEQNPFIKIEENFKYDKIVIIDPINHFNVAKSSFKNKEISNAFIKALNIIKIDAWKLDQQQEIKYNQKDLKILYSIFNLK